MITLNFLLLADVSLILKWKSCFELLKKIKKIKTNDDNDTSWL